MCAKGVDGNSILSVQYCCEPKTSFKNLMKTNRKIKLSTKTVETTDYEYSVCFLLLHMRQWLLLEMSLKVRRFSLR